MTFTFWRKWLSRKRSHPATTCPRPRLEFLEDRLAPAMLTWTGLGGTNNGWSNPKNWVGNKAPNPLGGDTLVFGPGAAQKTAANDFINNPSFDAIQFTDSGYTLIAAPVAGATTVNLASGITDTAAGTNAVNLPLITLTSSQTFQTTRADATMTFASNITLGGNFLTGNTLTFDGPGTIDLVSGAIDPDPVFGSGSVVKHGSGTTIVETQNHYFGGTWIQQGILDVRAAFYGLGEPDDGRGLDINSILNPPLERNGATTVDPGATLRLGDVAHDVWLADNATIKGIIGTLATTLYVGGDGVNGMGAIVSVGRNNVIGSHDTSANHNIPNAAGRPAGGNIFLTTPNVTINVVRGSTLTHLMGIKDNLSPGAGVTKIGPGTLVYGGQFWRNDLIPTSKPPYNGGGFMPDYRDSKIFYSAANTYTGLTWVKDGTLLVQKHIVDEGTADHHYYDVSMTMPAPFFPQGGWSIVGDLEVGDGVGLPDSARVVQSVDLQFAPFIPNIIINADGQLEFHYTRSNTGELLLPITINKGNLNLPDGVAVETEQLILAGGTVTSIGTTSTPGVLAIDGFGARGADITQRPSDVTARIESYLLLLQSAPGIVTSHGTTPSGLDLDITGHVGDYGNVIFTGSGAMRLSADNTQLVPRVMLEGLPFGNKNLNGVSQLAGTVTLYIANNKALGTGEFQAGGRGVNETVVADGAARTLTNTLALTGAVAMAGANNLTFSNRVFLSGSTGLTLTLTVAGTGLLTLAGGVTEPTNTGVALVKNGPGTLLMLGSSDYQGATEVDAGTLRVDGSLLPGGKVIVAGGVLDGTGSVGSIVAQGGAVRPGDNGPGLLTAAAATFTTGGTFLVNINGLTQISGYGLLWSNGAVTLTSDGNPAHFPVLNAVVGFESPVGSSFTILHQVAAGPIGAGPTYFQAPDGTILTEGAAFTPVGAPAGELYQITYHGGPTGNDVVLTHVDTAPTITALTLSTQVALEHGTVNLSGTFTDPDLLDTFTLRISWGDGTTTTQALPQGARSFGPITHVYTAAFVSQAQGDKIATITATITDSEGASASQTTTVTVLNVDSTIGSFNPSLGVWYLRNSNSPGSPNIAPFAYGLPGWVPVVGDWDGDGVTTVGVVDPRTMTWYLRNSNSPGNPAIIFRYGLPGWVPVTGDWAGAGHTSIGVVDPSTGTWYLRKELSNGRPDAGVFRYGMPGWVPVTGDWDGNGTTTIGMVDPGSETWYLRNANSPGTPSYVPFGYGGPGWQPVTGDWAGFGSTSVGVVDPFGNWYLRFRLGSGGPNIPPFTYGLGGWKAVSGTWTLPAHALLAKDEGGGMRDESDGFIPHPSSLIPSALTGAELSGVVAEALARLSAAGVGPAVVGQLATAQYSVGSLGGGVLGLAFPGDRRVVISANASGYGWYVDASPLSDSAFSSGVTGGSLTAAPGSPAAGHMDLLTAVLHEMGHLAGLDDVNGTSGASLMAAYLTPGARKTENLDAVFAAGLYGRS